MKVICSWCKKEFPPKSNEKGTTHGICSDCLEKVKKELEKKRGKDK